MVCGRERPPFQAARACFSLSAAVLVAIFCNNVVSYLWIQ